MDNYDSELATETLQTALEYIVKLRRGLEHYLIPPIEATNTTDQSKQLLLIIEGLEWVIQVLQLTKKIQRNPVDMQETTETLKQLLEAMENNDTTLVEDLLSYEILPLLKSWQENITCDLTPEA